MKSLILPPTSLSIITTYKCTSACTNCCFQCNSYRKEKLSIKDIKKYIIDATNTYDTIKLLVLTGGECFIYGKHLISIIEFAI